MTKNESGNFQVGRLEIEPRVSLGNVAAMAVFVVSMVWTVASVKADFQNQVESNAKVIRQNASSIERHESRLVQIEKQKAVDDERSATIAKDVQDIKILLQEVKLETLRRVEKLEDRVNTTSRR